MTFDHDAKRMQRLIGVLVARCFCASAGQGMRPTMTKEFERVMDVAMRNTTRNYLAGIS